VARRAWSAAASGLVGQSVGERVPLGVVVRDHAGRSGRLEVGLDVLGVPLPGGGDRLDAEGPADDRGRPQRRQRVARQSLQPSADDLADGGRDPFALRPEAGQLDEEEGVAARPLSPRLGGRRVHGPLGDGRHQRGRLGLVQAGQLDAQGLPPGEHFCDVGQGAGRLGVATTRGDDGEWHVVRGHRDEVPQGAQGGLVGPVEVVEDDQNRSAPGGREHGPRDPVPGLERDLPRAGRAGLRRDDVGQGDPTSVPAGFGVALQSAQHVEPGPQRRRAVVLRAGPGGDAHPVRPGLVAEVPHQPGLADPRLSDHRREGGRALREAVQHGTELLPDGAPADVRSRRGRPRRRRRRGDRSRLLEPDHERGILAQDRLLQVRQLRARVEAGVLGEQLAEGAQRVERLDLSTGPQQREGMDRPEPFAQRLPRDRGLGRRQDAGVLADREQADEPGLLCGDAEPFERRALREDVGVVGQVGVRFAPPGGQGLVEPLDEGDRLRPARPPRPVAVAHLAGQRREAALAGPNVGGEPVHVDGVGVDLHQVPVVGRLQDRGRGSRATVGFEGLAQAGDVRVQRAVGRRRRVAGPHQVREQAGGDRPAGGHRQGGHDRARLASPDVDGRAGGILDPGGPEDEHAHRHTVTGGHDRTSGSQGLRKRCRRRWTHPTPPSRGSSCRPVPPPSSRSTPASGRPLLAIRPRAG
jgi:hypothetical protein